MIVTVTLNPALDHFIFLESFERGVIQRFSQDVFAPGGKGVNVSLLLSSLGVENRALGLAGGFTGRELCRLLEEAGCQTDFVQLPQGNTRVNVKLRCADGEETAFNGAGPAIPEQAVEELLERLSRLREGDALVLSGVLPAALPETAFPRVLEAARQRKARLVVDMEGDPLLAALPYRPFLIKPNEEELAQIFGIAGSLNVQEVKEYARELQRMGARNVVVSLGAKGALLLEENGQALFCRSVRGEAVSTVGAGDSLVAGFLYGYELHGSALGGLKWGRRGGHGLLRGHCHGGSSQGGFPQSGRAPSRVSAFLNDWLVKCRKSAAGPRIQLTPPSVSQYNGNNINPSHCERIVICSGSFAGTWRQP